MKVIEVKEHDPGAGNESIARCYPGPGVYYIARSKAIYVVSPTLAYIACFPADMPNQIKEIDDPKPVDAVKPTSDAAELIRALNLPLVLAAAMHKDAAVALADSEAMKGGAV